jgi:myo-inositol 2-dehydrogenase / D-chiro-inositol 1-dehydrogenase
MNEKLRIAVIGLGRIGKIHAETIATRVWEADLVAVADVDGDLAREVGGRFHVPQATDEYRSILEQPHIDAVAICTPTDSHARIIREAAAAGKHIFCEKPIDHKLAVIDSTLEVVAQAGVKLQVGFNRRFDPGFCRAREMVARGEIGRAHLLRITSRDPAPPPLDYIRVSGGLFLDMTCHDFDMARYLMDSEVTELFATGGVMVDPAIGEAGDIDTAVITLRFANGAIGTIDNSRQAVYGYDQRIELFGSAGLVTVANKTADNHVHCDAHGVHSALPLYFFLERYMDAYIAEMKAFVQAVLNDTPPPVSGRDGRMATVMALAAQQSYHENRPVALTPAG